MIIRRLRVWRVRLKRYRDIHYVRWMDKGTARWQKRLANYWGAKIRGHWRGPDEGLWNEPGAFEALLGYVAIGFGCAGPVLIPVLPSLIFLALGVAVLAYVF